MRHRSLFVLAFSLAPLLAAGRAAAEAHCVSDIRDAAPDGSFCHGHIDAMNGQAQQPTLNPAAATQLTNMAGGLIGNALGNALVAPLPNQYQGRKPVKPVVTDDDGIRTPGTGAASDIIGNYKPDDDSYAARLAHFRELHDAEMDRRREALAKLKGTSAEKWCASHINILFPMPPMSDVLNRYANTVRAYDREKQTWDKRCGGPSSQPGYQSFTEELAALKPDAAPSAGVAGTTAKAPTYETPAPPPAAEPEKPAADSFADAEKELEGPPAKKSAAVAEAPSAPPAQSAPADVGAAPDSSASPDDSANTNHATELFGEKNAKVTAKDLADTRAPELEDLRPGTMGSAGGSGTGGGVGKAPSGARPPASNTNEPAIAGQTPQMLSTKPAPNNFMPNMFSGRSPKEIERDRCQVSCSDVMAKQSEALERFRRNSVAFPKAIIMGPLNYGIVEAKKLGAAIANGTDEVKLEAAHFFDMFDLRACGPGATIGVADTECSKRAIPNAFKPTVSNWKRFTDAGNNTGTQATVFMKDFKSSVVDIADQREANGYAALSGKFSPKKKSLLDDPDLLDSTQDLRDDLSNTKDGIKAAVDYAHGIDRCSESENIPADCFKENNKLWDKLTPMMDGTPAMLPVSLVGAAKDAIQDYATDLLNTWKDLMSAAADCLGGCQ